MMIEKTPFLTKRDGVLFLYPYEVDIGLTATGLINVDGEDYPGIDFKGELEFRYSGLLLYANMKHGKSQLDRKLCRW
jgi:hypothetical protein